MKTKRRLAAYVLIALCPWGYVFAIIFARGY
jgi:hypothetical protein